MTSAPLPPKKKNPQKRVPPPASPPAPRSRQALVFSAFAARGILALQTCQDCGTTLYPFRDICPSCLSDRLYWREVDGEGTLIAETTIRVSTNNYYIDRLPWRIGSVCLQDGPSVIAHLHGALQVGDRVRLLARTDRAGRGVLFARPNEKVDPMNEDRQWRELTCGPKFRRVLITDGQTPLGKVLAKALVAAGATKVFLGHADMWHGDEPDAPEPDPKIEIVPLDLTDTTSVNELAATIGGEVDILINTADYVRPGGMLGTHSLIAAQEAMNVNYFGLLRLIQAFGPALRERGDDGASSACAWVNLIPVYAMANWPSYGAHSACAAAVRSATQCLQAEMRGSGVKVIAAFTGPTNGEWYKELAPPKLSADAIANAIVAALQEGVEEVAIGPIAQDVVQRWRENADLLARELADTGVE